MPQPRWKYANYLFGLQDPELHTFVDSLAVVHYDSSNFSKKVIVALIQIRRAEKRTLAENHLKLTKNRFSD